MYPDYRCEAYPVNYSVIFIHFKLAYLLLESTPVITLVILLSLKWPSCGELLTRATKMVLARSLTSNLAMMFVELLGRIPVAPYF